MMPENFNDKHPELEEGEIFLVNIKPEEKDRWKIADAEKARIGKVAYTNTGEVVDGYFPLFATPKKTR